MTKYLTSTVRHALTALVGYLGYEGIVDESVVQGGVAVIGFIGIVGWSWIEKKFFS